MHLSREKFCILFGEDVIGHNRQAVPIAQPSTKSFHQRGLARAHRSTDANHRNAGIPGPGWSAALLIVMMAVHGGSLGSKESRFEPTVPHGVDILHRRK
jgi:hypothetical protein